MANLFIIQRYCARNDSNGNPRRVYVIRNDQGTIVATIDEDYAGGRVAGQWLARHTNVPDFDPRSSIDWQHAPGVTFLGDVDVAPGVYRRMLKHSTDD